MIPESVITMPGITDHDPGIGDHVKSESVITIVRNTHLRERREIDDVIDQILKMGKEGKAQAVSLLLIPAESGGPLVESLLGIEQPHPVTSCFNLIRAPSSETRILGSAR